MTSLLFLSVFIAQQPAIPVVAADGTTTTMTLDASTPILGVELPPEGREIEHVVDEVGVIYELFKSGNYPAAVAALIMLLIVAGCWIMLRLGKKVRTEWLPTFAVIGGTLAVVALKLKGLEPGAGAIEWLFAVGKGIGIGLMASGGYSFIGKKVFGKWLKQAEKKGHGKSTEAGSEG